MGLPVDDLLWTADALFYALDSFVFTGKYKVQHLYWPVKSINRTKYREYTTL